MKVDIDDSKDAMELFQVDVNIEEPKWSEQINNIEIIVEKLCFAVIKEAGLLNVCSGGEVSVLLTDDKSIKKLNKQYRHHDKATNVLAFPIAEIKPSNLKSEQGKYTVLGDIIISFNTTMAEAKEQNKSFEHHFCHLIIHGALHLLGYDHINDKDAKAMEQLEIKLLDKFGIVNPYSF